MPEPERTHHNAEQEMPSGLSEATRKLLMWQRDGFKDGVFSGKDADGIDEVRESFTEEDGHGSGSEEMIRVLDFLSSRMRIDDGGKLRDMLTEFKVEGAVSVLSSEDKLEPAEVLRNLLTGGYDENISSDIARRGDAYTLALYLYMHTSDDSRQEAIDTLSQFVEKYDDPNENLYEHGRTGLLVEPFLADLCIRVLERYGIKEDIREKVTDALGNLSCSDRELKEIGSANLKRVMRKSNRDVQHHGDSSEGIHPFVQ